MHLPVRASSATCLSASVLALSFFFCFLIAVPPEALAQFEVKEEEREFTGDADDRKGMLEHRQKLQARVRELEKAKKEFIEEQRAKHEEALKESLVDVKSHESVLRKAEKALDSARTAVEAAERAVATAERRLQQEQKRAEKRAEKAEKEQRKKYPIDDLELLEDVKAAAAAAGGAGQPALDPDVHQPTWLPGEEGARLANALYVSDIFNQFGRALGIKALNFVELEKLLQSAAECAGKGSAAGADGGPAALHAAYYRALHLILEDLKEQKMATAAERRWLSLLSDGTWPEVLRRLVLTRASYDQPYAHPSKPATMAASMMAFDGADELTYDQHMALLSFLADEILDSGRMRTILQSKWRTYSYPLLFMQTSAFPYV